jgi:multidrug resistance efflux pump
MIRKKVIKNKVFFIFLVLLVLCAVYYYWLYKEPYTQNAFVTASIRPVTSFVPGYITSIYAKNNTFLRKGDKIFDIYQKPYQLKISRLQHQLAEAEFKAAALVSLIKLSEFNVNKIGYKLKNANYLSHMMHTLAKTHAVSEKVSEVDLRKKQSVLENLNVAKEKMNVARQNYNEVQAKIKVVKTELELADLDLEWTTVYAKADGYVTNMYLTPGTYVKPGNVLFAFIDTERWWIQANFEETELSNIKEGLKASIKLWQYPGKTFEGVVTATGWGVQRRKMSDKSGMPVVEKENEWFLLPQRYPVQIKLLNVDKKYKLHPGGTAWVRVHTSAKPIRQFFWRYLQF